MKKVKIFDIIPPKKTKLFTQARQSRAKGRDETIVSSTKAREPKPSIFLKLPIVFKKRIFIGLLIFLIAGFLIFFFLPGKAKIEILPKMENLTFKCELKVDSLAKEINLEVIPGQLIETEEFLSQEFPASGKAFKEERASGTIQVYNNYSLSPQVLIDGTRFVSADGKLFRTPKRITIPGKHYEGGKLVPGFVDIEVIADQPGPEYNIGLSTFSLPGLAGTVMYTAIYAKSFQEMKGGFRREVLQVTKDDLEGGTRVLEEKVKEKVETSLKRKIPEDSILIKDAQIFEKGQLSLLAREGEEKSSFWGEAKAKGTALIFKKSDLNKWALGFIRAEISEKVDEAVASSPPFANARVKEVRENSFNYGFTAKNIDFQKGSLLLKVELSAQIFSKIDEKALKELIKGKEEKEVERKILENYPEISEIRLELFPFWLRKIPKDDKLLEIKLKI
ncbi:MAG: hypothetical protein COS47_00105 [Candidatus Nealsonbacteria bacterium CG03_land_8_20_14_0_80_36_12]|uniref:Baseplate protein J-like domain-containing protein n=1 Tax=Candidatus Nealsonbacteria bacterium CG03_land_8_20_14_0_80_36_12 TaxID=1974701 RepID=A0A2M7BYW4_9BACT|nr:MAG: hypothetical protein COS47_00105 [Candidatus Nealsonbacteria bacterium CG03_land_8_20_14_0_80_36_12]